MNILSNFKQNIEEKGLEQAKNEWEETRDGDLNKEIVSELTPEEKAEWKRVVDRTNKLFNPTQENKEPINWTPWLIGGGITVVGIGLIIFFTKQKKRR